MNQYQIPSAAQGALLPVQPQNYSLAPDPSSLMTAPMVEPAMQQAMPQNMQQAVMQQPAPAPVSAPVCAPVYAQVPAHAPAQAPAYVQEQQAAPAVPVDSSTFKGCSQSILELPESIDKCMEFAEYISKSLLVPSCIRNKKETVFMLLATAKAYNIPWPNVFTTLYVIPFGSEYTIGMYVDAKAALCKGKGIWNVSVDYKTGTATATGKRFDNNEEQTVVYTAFDASLSGNITLDKDGNIVGLKNWSKNWPHMLRQRALGRLLNVLFPDVLRGLVTKDEFDDMAYEEALSREQMTSPFEKESAAALSKSRKSRAKAKEPEAVKEAANLPTAHEPNPLNELMVEDVLDANPLA